MQRARLLTMKRETLILRIPYRALRLMSDSGGTNTAMKMKAKTDKKTTFWKLPPHSDIWRQFPGSWLNVAVSGWISLQSKERC